VARHKCGANAERFRFLNRWRLHQREQNTALFQYRPRTLLRFVPDEVEHKIDIARHVFEFLFRVVDRFVHAEFAQQFLIFSRGRRENVRAFPLRQLHGNVANAAAAGMNQHALTWLQLRSVEQCLPRGHCRQRQCRRADVMKRVRFEREF